MKIKSMHLEDIAQVHRLGTNVDEFKVDESEAIFWDLSVLKQIVLSNTDVALISEDDERINGFSIMTYHPPTRKATFENLYVSPTYRGSGLAKQLAEASISKVIDLGANYICAMVETQNYGSSRLLEKVGFEIGKEYLWMSRQT